MPLNINWQQILLHLLNFAILAGGLYLLLYQPVKSFMDQRKAHYAEMEANAQKALEEAEAQKEAYEKQLQTLHVELEARKAEAQHSLEETARTQLQEASRKAAGILEDARKDAQRQQEKTLRDTNAQIRKLAVSAAQKLVLESDGEAFDQFLHAADRRSRHESTH